MIFSGLLIDYDRQTFKSLILSLVFTLLVGSAWGESFIVDDIRIRGLNKLLLE